jgi:hypothetical protein
MQRYITLLHEPTLVPHLEAFGLQSTPSHPVLVNTMLMSSLHMHRSPKCPPPFFLLSRVMLHVFIAPPSQVRFSRQDSLCKIQGYCSSVAENTSILGYETVFGRTFPYVTSALLLCLCQATPM